jgi:hypothetical protein
MIVLNHPYEPIYSMAFRTPFFVSSKTVYIPHSHKYFNIKQPFSQELFFEMFFYNLFTHFLAPHCVSLKSILKFSNN